MLARNIKKRRPIDMRDTRSCKSSETESSFKITLYVSQSHMATQTFKMHKAAMPKNYDEHRRTYWPRFVAALHLPLDARREVEIKGMAGEHIVVHHWAEGLPAFEFNGLFDAFDVAPHDAITLEFTLDSGKITSVDVTIEEAKDKALTRELEELLARERAIFDEDQQWEAIAWLFRRCFAASRIKAAEGHVSICQLEFGPDDDFYAFATYVEWSWNSPDEVGIQMSAPRDTSLFPVDTREDYMAALGWSVPSIADFDERENDDPFEFFTLTLNHPHANDVVKLICQSLRHGFLVPTTNDLLIRPEELAEVALSLKGDTPEQRRENRKGMLTPQQRLEALPRRVRH